MAQQAVARIHAPNQVKIDQLPLPQIGPDDILVEVKACGICGSDLTYLAMGGLIPDAPMPIGHEFAGRIHSVGANVREYAVGDGVAGNPDARGIGNGGPEGAMGSFILIPDAEAGRALHKLDPALSFEKAALAEPLSVALHGIDLAGAKPTEKAVVLGAGPIGICAVLMLRHRGIDDIVVIDRVPSRLERAKKLGAKTVVNGAETSLHDALAAAHGSGERYGNAYVETDIFIDAAGAPALISEAIGIAKFGARLSIIALYKQDVPINLYQVMANELKITGSIADNRSAGFDECVRYLESAEFDVDALISHRMTLSDLREALDIAASPELSAKVMILPS